MCRYRKNNRRLKWRNYEKGVFGFESHNPLSYQILSQTSGRHDDLHRYPFYGSSRSSKRHESVRSQKYVYLVLVGYGDEVPLEFDGVERLEYGGQRAFGQRRADYGAATGHGFSDAVRGTADDSVERAQSLGERGRPDVDGRHERRRGPALQVPGYGVGRSDQQHARPVPVVVVRVHVRGRALFAQLDGRQVAGRVLAGRVVGVPAGGRRAGPRGRRFRLHGSKAAAAAVMTR